MSFLQKLLSIINPQKSENITSPELIRLYDVDTVIGELLSNKHYIAQSEYKWIISEKQDLINWFDVLTRSGTIKEYCKNNNTSVKKDNDDISKYSHLPELIDNHNEPMLLR